MIKKKKKQTQIQTRKPFLLKWGGFIALGLSLIVLSPTLLNGFVNWDDQEYVLDNRYIQNLSFENIAYLFTNDNASNYHPLTMISLGINHLISGLNAWSYHLFNLLFHLANVFLVFLLCKKLFKEKIWIPFIVAILFGIHPMHVESVAWISERKDVLYLFFFLISIIYYINYLEGAKRTKYIYALVFYGLSLLSKPAAITLAPLLLLIDWHFERRDVRKIIIEKIPFFALALLFTFITYQIQEVTAVKTYSALGFLDRFSLGGTAYSIYIFKSIFPFNLNCFYAFPSEILAWMNWAAISALLFTIGWFYIFRKHRTVLFGSLFFIITTLLYLHIISFGDALLSERYTYLSYIGIFIILGVFFEKLMNLKYQKLAGVLGIGYLLFLSIISLNQSQVWKDGKSLWTNSVDHMMIESAKPFVNLASAYIKLKDENSALQYYEKALGIDPYNFDALNNSGIIYSNRNNYQEALRRYNLALAQKPTEVETYVMRGNTLFRIQNYEAAIQDYNYALSLNSNHVDAYNNRGTIQFNVNRNYLLALSDFNQAIRINPNHGNAHLNRSRCLYQMGNYIEALSAANKARDLGVPVDPVYINQIMVGI